MDPLLVKNILMLYGHMIANLAMYAALGILLAMLPIITGRELQNPAADRAGAGHSSDRSITALRPPPLSGLCKPRALLLIGEFVSFASTVPVLLVEFWVG